MYKKTIIIFLILMAAIISTSYSQDKANHKTTKLIGEQMSLAVFPFQNKEVDQELVDRILDELIMAFSIQKRFMVKEKSQLNKIVKERHLELLWKIDIPIAAEIGREYGVDAIVLTTVSTRQADSINIDAIVIDSESGLIIISDGAVAENRKLIPIKGAVERLVSKIAQGLPIVQGSILQVNDDYTILLDKGKNAGIRRGMRCTIYKKDIVRQHPITGKILAPKIQLLGEVLIIESLDKIATAQLLNFGIESLSIAVGDKFITK